MPVVHSDQSPRYETLAALAAAPRGLWQRWWREKRIAEAVLHPRYQLVVQVMRANPEPDHRISITHSQSAIVKPNAD
ncbi:MAG: hypothetical protein HY680_08650 [Chloroflexi bacterium]|nr:hypothetical protein [Chloroflexota bacterium]